MTTRLRVLALVTIGIAAAWLAVALFPRAFPAIALENRLTQRTALARADSFFAAHQLAGATSRRAVFFGADREMLTYLDLAAGGSDTVNAIVRGRDAAPFSWGVRAFAPGEVREARVTFAPDGRAIGFRNTLADSTKRADIGADSATALARVVLASWLGERLDRWTVTATSYETKKPSDRVDRKITFERTDRKVGEAPFRFDVTIAGDTPGGARPYLEIPESFNRRYGEMRSANELYSLFSTVGAVVLLLLGVWTIRRFGYHHALRWRAPIAVGGTIGALLAAAGVNSLGAAWYAYDTATPAGIFQAITLAAALAGGVMMGALVTLTLVAAEAASRTALPGQVDWWQLWRARGTRAVAGQVLGGYVVAAIGFAYVAVFYTVTRGTFGWWVPSELLDDPNLIATPAPWLAGIALSLQAGVWEETLFRALPLSLLSLWVGTRPRRAWWMAGGVVLTALVFGFAHASYPSWPPYSRGVEIFLDACFWAVLFLRFGLLVTVLAHFTYDAVLFSIFTATGNAVEYRVAAAIAVLAIASPALVVAWRFIRQRGFAPLEASMTFAAWRPGAAEAQVTVAAPAAPGALSPRTRQFIGVVVAAAVVLVFAAPRAQVRGPAYRAGRVDAERAADSLFRARNPVAAGAILGAERGPAAGWRRLSTTASDTQPALTRFLREHDLDSIADPLARSYAQPAWWVVRYVRTAGTVAERAEEWRVRVYPDGTPLDIRHVVPDSAPGDSLAADSVRRIARRALARAGLDTLRYRESDYAEVARPHRRDATVTWTDTMLKLPAGAVARAWVTVAGSEPLVARRGIELPEAFRRADRERQTRAFAMGGLFIVLLLGATVTGAIFVTRSRPQLVTDRTFDRRTSFVLLGLLAALNLAELANGWPNITYNWNTSTPWSTHVTEALVLGAMSPLLGVLLLAGLWLTMEALRRRAGIAAWPAAASPDGARWAARDAVLAGVGLGAAVVVTQLLPDLARSGGIAPAPSTLLDQAVPSLGSALGVGTAVVVQLTTAAIPLLLIVALVRARWARWAIVVGVVALGVALLWPAANTIRPEPPTPAATALGLTGLVLSVGALVTWGARSAYTWLVAALAASVLEQVHGAVQAGTAPEGAGSLIGAATALVLLAWIGRRAGLRRTAVGGGTS